MDAIARSNVASIAAVKPDLRLVDALEHRNRQDAMSLLEQHVDVNAPQPDGATPLHWATQPADEGLRLRAGRPRPRSFTTLLTPMCVTIRSPTATR